MPSYYPVYLDLTGRECLVVGGGDVAERKIFSLLEAGAKVKVVSPVVTGRIRRLAEDSSITLVLREYRPGDLKGVFLAISATDNPDTNRAITGEAKQNNILLNVVDSPAECNFIVPSVVRRGDLVISISTFGKSPALARKIRERIQRDYGEEYGPLLEILGFCRNPVIKLVPDIETRGRIFKTLVELISPEAIRAGDVSGLMNSVRSALGEAAEGFPFRELETMVREIISRVSRDIPATG